MDWLSILLIVFLNAIVVLLVSYLNKKGYNRAEKEDIKDISMRSELGKNLATKQDISEITEKIETIKNEISFENQRKHSFINERHMRFVNILSLAEEFRASEMQLYYLMYNPNGFNEITSLITHINKTTSEIVHECRMLMINIKDDDILKVIDSLMTSSQSYSTYLCITASNAASYLSEWHDFFHLAEKYNNSKKLLEESRTSQNKLFELRENFLKDNSETWEKHYNNIIKYLVILKGLYGKEFHLRYNLNDKETYPIL